MFLVIADAVISSKVGQAGKEKLGERARGANLYIFNETAQL